MSEFIFGNAALDSHSLMLYKEGVGVDYLTHTATVCVCDQCMVFLKVATVPKFALKNHLYHGYLPSEFSDITWVEEMAVAIYHSTAFITWLYFSDDPKNPHVFHGNTCACNDRFPQRWSWPRGQQTWAQPLGWPLSHRVC